METLRNLVKNLAVILLIATFLEMLLPKKSMRGYVQLVMGLFVISAVLSPISSLLKAPLALEIPAWSQAGQQDLPVLAGQGTAIGQNAVQEQYRKILINQIKAIAVGVSGVKDVKADIRFLGKQGGITDQPEIESVRITLLASKQEIEPIKPVVIGESNKDKEVRTSQVAEEVREKVSVFMQLPKEKVFVNQNQ